MGAVWSHRYLTEQSKLSDFVVFGLLCLPSVAGATMSVLNEDCAE